MQEMLPLQYSGLGFFKVSFKWIFLKAELLYLPWLFRVQNKLCAMPRFFFPPEEFRIISFTQKLHLGAWLDHLK